MPNVKAAAITNVIATGITCDHVRPYVVPESHVKMRGVSHGLARTSSSVETADVPYHTPTPISTRRSAWRPPRQERA